MKHVVNFSGGKDSTAMLHILLDGGVPVTDVVYFDSGWDFPQMEDHIALVEKNTGIKITRVQPARSFTWGLARYGWPRPGMAWCTAMKCSALNKFHNAIKEKTVYIGFSADETKRANRPGVSGYRFPLIEKGISEKAALKYCVDLGYHWGGLYNYMSRVSCFCCPCAGASRRNIVRYYFPDLWRKWLQLDSIANEAYKENNRLLI